MEKFINEETIIKNEIYESLKKNIYCSLCNLLMIDSFECSYCYYVFCKICFEFSKKENGNCPFCKKPFKNENIQRNSCITKMKFKCIKGCGIEILFNDIENHYNTDCLSKKVKIKILEGKEKEKYIKEINGKIPVLTSKNKY